ncbi:MAG: DUF11 domain-containing protein, partial [Pyrinomonadaceae bacterium]|nr:DUF11 domain-containing protein [Pyrinomonadaceae bacterium]
MLTGLGSKPIGLWSLAVLLLIFFNTNLNGQIATRVFYNPSFELPATGCNSNWSQIPQSEVTGWRTTDNGTSRTDCGNSTGSLTNPIEIWTTGFLGINAQSGNQIAEINATMNGYLYQTVCMLPNESFNYSIWHHRRNNSGTDTMRARITDTSGNLISETGNLSSSNNSWNNFTGTLTNNGTAGIRRFGYVAISTATGDISVGNLIDNTSFSIRPLVDIKQFNPSTIFENGGTGNLEVYVNGTLRSTATVVLTKTGTATITTDYTVGSPSRGSISVDGSGNITLTLPAGDYDPNFSSGTNAGFIRIPITAVNDTVSDNNETAIYTVGAVSGGGGSNSTLDLAASISGWSASCSTAVSTATLTIQEPTDLTITKSHTGSFTVGSSGNYSFAVTNSGSTTSSGTITVTDTLPSGLTVNNGAAGGITEGGTNSANWTCNSNAASPQVITCTSSTAIAASGTSVFNFNVNVGLGTAVGTNSVTNSASVSGGGQTNTANDSATDPTTILSPNLTIAKSHT